MESRVIDDSAVVESGDLVSARQSHLPDADGLPAGEEGRGEAVGGGRGHYGA